VKKPPSLREPPGASPGLGEEELPISSTPGDAKTSTPHGDKSARLQGSLVFIKNLLHEGYALARGYVRQPHQATVGHVVKVDELTKVRVYRHQNTLILGGLFEECLVSGIGSELPCLDDIVTVVTQPLGQSAARTTVDEQTRHPATEMGSRLSRAMTAWA
jgi:hypothetical protein